MPQLAEWLAIIRRRLWLILGSTLVFVGLAVAYTLRATPIYEAVSKVRFDDKQPNIPEFYRTLSTGREVLTEMEVLQSRTIARDVATELGLQVRLLKPKNVARADLFSGIRIAPDARTELYILRRHARGQFVLLAKKDSERVMAEVSPGDKVSVDGVVFTLSPQAGEHDEIQFVVQTVEDAVDQLVGNLAVAQVNRDANIASVAYRDADRQLAAEVPNALVSRFIARRHNAQKTEARSTVSFLRQQIDTLARQLAEAENRLRSFREQQGVVNPEIEANTQVTRLITVQSERGSIESERLALAELMDEVRSSRGRGAPGEPSPYRRLLAFPTLLRNQTASDMLRQLATVEDQRTSLLSRRTPDDPDVIALDGRVAEIEGQIESMAATYLQGLSNQVASLDSTLRRFGGQLAEVPRRQLEFARLTRQPQVLEEMYALLQTRLKEAEIAQAVEDPSVQIVDPAMPPKDPVRPRPIVNVAGGLFVGLMLGLTGAFLREYMDRSVHTRADVRLATGLPVLGLIPRIAGRGGPIAMISTKRSLMLPASSEPRDDRRPPEKGRTGFTFWPSAEASTGEKTNGQKPGNGMQLPAQVQRVTITTVGAAIAEAYGSLRTNLLFARGGDAVRSIVLTSAQPGEGKTTTAVNLAISLAHRGASALLIDADLRRGMVHTVFGASRQPGLSDLVQGNATLEQVLRVVNVDHGQPLHYITSGTLPANPAGMMESEQLRDLLALFKERYDTIIIDAPPATVITDAALLGAQADGVVLVARAGVTHAAALAILMEQLNRVRAQLLGVILNDIDFKRDAAYDPAYQYQVYTQYTANSRE